MLVTCDEFQQTVDGLSLGDVLGDALLLAVERNLSTPGTDVAHDDTISKIHISVANAKMAMIRCCTTVRF